MNEQIFSYLVTIAAQLPVVMKDVEGAVAKVRADAALSAKVQDSLEGLAEVFAAVAKDL